MKLFLTGGTGFVGSHFINMAHANGYEILALRREHSKPRVKLIREPHWICGDLSGNYEELLGDCEVLVHLASHSTNPPYDTFENCIYWNVNMSIRLFEQAAKAGIHNFLVAGSCFEYGRSGDRFNFIPIDAPLEPTASYPASKAAASVIFHAWAIENSIKLQIQRIFHVFGEGELPTRLWPSLRAAAKAGADFQMTHGEQVRDFVSVTAVAEKFVESLDFKNCKPGQPVIKNIGSGKPETVRSFSEYWWNYWNAEGDLKFGEYSYRENEVMRFVPEIN